MKICVGLLLLAFITDILYLIFVASNQWESKAYGENDPEESINKFIVILSVILFTIRVNIFIYIKILIF